MFPIMTETASQTQNILLIEDDADVRSAVERVLGGAGFAVRSARDGESGLRLALAQRPELVLVDVGLPDRDGVSVTRELREKGFRSPILMLTARGTVSDKVSGLEAGADDYLPKPFDLSELIARVKALLRRASIAADHTLRAGDVVIDPLTRRVERAGREIELTQKEYALLEFLARNAGRPVSRSLIAEHVWKYDVDPATNVVDVYINYLRKKLGDDKTQPLIRTVRGVGYMISGA
ncbi:MAG TPA: response regulator transcription factor [Gemmatimonadaceae bacterium]|nr:response regulator transcription factor [Gemmatimonadaceae bacterium]